MVLVLLSLVLSIRIHFSAGICLRPHQNAVKYNDCIQLKFKTWKMSVCVYMRRNGMRCEMKSKIDRIYFD